jgi:2-polyprenyl-3-methyl-5-hydroxy-6-metoxy-1,4-benzoquinol methylase
VGSAVGTTHTLNEMPVGSASLLRPPRTDAPEMLDLGQGTLADVRQNLHEMWRINGWLGGMYALKAYVLPRIQSQAIVLDIGTGGAEIPVYLMQWAEKSGASLQVIGLDWAARNLSVASDNTASQPGITLMRANALELPFAASNIDVVFSSLFLHHFSADDVIKLLRGVYQCARCSIVMTDLVRGWLPLIAFKLITPIFARNHLTRYDGALSIRRAYTPAELYALACQAGLPHARIYSHWPWRMTLVADKS